MDWFNCPYCGFTNFHVIWKLTLKKKMPENIHLKIFVMVFYFIERFFILKYGY